MVSDFDPFTPDVVREPHAFYAALRREAPLHRLPNGAYYLISRYRDVRDAAMNTETFSSNLVAVLLQGMEHKPELLALEGAGTGSVDALAIADPPVHARQRKIANQVFSMRRVASSSQRSARWRSRSLKRFCRDLARSGVPPTG
jgi:cytochrome P450